MPFAGQACEFAAHGLEQGVPVADRRRVSQLREDQHEVGAERTAVRKSIPMHAQKWTQRRDD